MGLKKKSPITDVLLLNKTIKNYSDISFLITWIKKKKKKKALATYNILVQKIYISRKDVFFLWYSLVHSLLRCIVHWGTEALL